MLVHLEAQVLGVKLDRLVHVLDLIPDRSGPEVRLLILALDVGLGRRGRLIIRPADHRQQPDRACRHLPRTVEIGRGKKSKLLSGCVGIDGTKRYMARQWGDTTPGMKA